MSIQRANGLYLAVAAMTALSISATLPATADKKNPAPVVFGQTGSKPVQSAQPVSSVAMAREDRFKPVIIKVAEEFKDPRIDFDYPDTEQRVVGKPAVAKAYAALPTPPVTSAAPKSILPEPTEAPQPKASGPIRITATENSSVRAASRPLTLSSAIVRPGADIANETGLAGVYTEGFHGKPTANGEIFDDAAMTAAHPSLPLPSLVQVTNLKNGREIVVRVNDRGPFEPGRLIDLSKRAADVIGVASAAPEQVRVRYLGPAPVQMKTGSVASRSVVADTMETPSPVAQVASVRPKPVRVAARAGPAPAPKAVIPGKVYIQTGAFTDIRNAQAMNDALGRRLQVNIEPARVNNADYFRVLVGPFDTEREAETYLRHLKDDNVTDGFLVTR